MFGTDTTPAQSYVKDVTETDFMTEVVDASMSTPVIVDFWAPWCGPCKQLGPMLEEAVNAAKGKVLMAKINVDENQRLAQALAQQGLPLQSIPTVVAFFEGRPVDMFQGAVPASQVKAFVEKLAGMAGDGGLGEAIAAAEEMLTQGAAVDAAETFAAILGEEPENAEAYGGLVRAHLAAGNVDQAEQLLAAAPDKIATSAPVEAARAQLALAKQAAEAGPLDDLKAKVDANPDDHQARFDYATALHAAGQVEEAVEELLELFRRDREWNDAAAKTQLFTIFDALKPTDPIVAKGRRRLSSMIFA
ncbi:co-chaperone YbbN [Rhodobacter sp. TJ_12]|uniref:tetratricopeptide repeat protein n=1 Tax=Rhodobacter sp. TJ_12 TaxID=2029399 RepID=UPI001CBC523E|nr:tetratricopeptide repeat protein [Rhodobacter sp. TJ_12]MBZ4020990.1 co-chaperone YbbN [Rhodobacter sp. TJ_12]